MILNLYNHYLLVIMGISTPFESHLGWTGAPSTIMEYASAMQHNEQIIQLPIEVTLFLNIRIGKKNARDSSSIARS
jgi:hypothetical protein